MLNLMMEVLVVVLCGWLIEFEVKVIKKCFQFFDLARMNLRIIIEIIDHRYF